MKRILWAVLAASVLSWTPGVEVHAAAASAENRIAIAARIALDGTGSEARGIAEPVPAANSVDQSSVVTPSRIRVEALATVAAEISATVPVNPDVLLAAWQTTSPQRLNVMLAALSQVGTAYRYGGSSPSGFDCSGLTSFAWASVGVRLPRTSTLQIEQAAPRDVSQLRAGDLLWRPGHIGMSLGVPDIMVNATQTGRPVEVKRWGRVVRAGTPIGE